MPKSSVYIETTVVSYLTARPSQDPLIRAHQDLTRQWWNERAAQFDLYTSRFVLIEASAGDPAAAAERIDVLKTIPRLDISAPVEPLAERFLLEGALPAK